MEYRSIFSPNTGKYGPEVTPYLDNFLAVRANTEEKNFITRIKAPIFLEAVLAIENLRTPI